MTTAQPSTKALAVPQRKERTPFGDAVQQLLKNKLAVVSGGFILLLIFIAIFADFLNGYTLQGYDTAPMEPFAKQVLQDNNARPGSVTQSPNLSGFVYWLGADNLGRDLWTRTLYGTRVSITVAIIASTVSLIVGLVYGLIAGYMGGRIDNFMMRVVDFLYGLPTIIVVILMQVYFKALARQGSDNPVVNLLLGLNASMGGLLFIFIALGLLNWLGMARIARGQTLSLKQKEFIEAAKSIGATTPSIIFKQILPNIIGPCIVSESLAIPGYILTESFLSFIGLGVDAPTPSWGIMINEAYKGLRSSPHELFAPAFALTLTVLAFNFLGDGLRDAFDPKMKR